MLEDAQKEINSLILQYPKVNFIAFTKESKVMLSTTDSLMPREFEDIVELLEWLENN